ncbi:MAG TPA: SPW repeat protein [Anaerolineae bacterium]|nr:SPW repeat protein [Anaerolineae bacterium]
MGVLPWISCALGAWAAVAPFVFPWDVCTWVWLAGIIPGILVFLLSGGYALRPGKSLAWLQWLSALLGVWLIVSPFIAGYAIVLDVVLGNFLPGALIAILSAVAGYSAMQAE